MACVQVFPAVQLNSNEVSKPKFPPLACCIQSIQTEKDPLP
jgi:hypothetical protein